MILIAVPGTDRNFEHAKAIGANYVHLYGLSYDASPKGMKAMRDYLDLAQKHGLKVMFDLDGHRRMAKPDGLEEMRRIVTAFKNHPALGFWYLADEPELNGTTAQTTEKYYKLIKAESPDIPVCLLTATMSSWNGYLSSLDVYSFDIYPVSTAPFPQASIESVTDFNQWALTSGKPVLPCLQAFNYVIYDAEKLLKKSKLDDPEERKRLMELRYPTQAELRYWHFATLAQGAQGAIYYGYLPGGQTGLAVTDPITGETLSTPDPTGLAPKNWQEGTKLDPKWLDNTLKPAIAELKSFTDTVAPAWKHEAIPSGQTQNIMQAAWKRGDKTYVVMVNNWPLARYVLVSEEMMSFFQNGKAKPWGFSRQTAPQVDQNGNRMLDLIYPWEVLVWEIQAKS
ncbi:MAG: hypothetical protein IT446_11755 [Phycisphaerales bacterium]|nr:hypothetical protein [Phycisphaerales bacterium]